MFDVINFLYGNVKTDKVSSKKPLNFHTKLRNVWCVNHHTKDTNNIPRKPVASPPLNQNSKQFPVLNFRVKILKKKFTVGKFKYFFLLPGVISSETLVRFRWFFCELLIIVLFFRLNNQKKNFNFQKIWIRRPKKKGIGNFKMKIKSKKNCFFFQSICIQFFKKNYACSYNLSKWILCYCLN